MTERDQHPPPENEAPDLGEFLGSVAADAQGYFEARKALITLDLSERGGRIAARAVWIIVALLLVALGIGLLAAALGLYLGRVLHDNVLGFLAAGGVLFATTGLFYLLWRWVLRERIILAVINAAHAKPEHLP
ncbi:MAG: hypothetical protein JNL52_03275 [Flavobacteriales bacterium]|nr:hypothetical protein [Flavobacteriales bacterium]